MPTPATTSTAAATAATTTQASNESSNCIRNFRAAVGLRNVYRCAKTDGLADRLNADWSVGERILLLQAGLILDLRSDAERDEIKSVQWMAQAAGGSFAVYRDNYSLRPQHEQDKKDNSSSSSTNRQRAVLRLDPLSPTQFMAYLDDHWLTPAQKLQAAMFKIVSGEQLHSLRIQVLNGKGLSGLNEAILETGKRDLFAALQAMTLHLEKHPGDTVVIHCVQGKDRTGLLVMLCQSLLGVADEEIVADYHRSEATLLEGSAAVKTAVSKRQAGKIDKLIFGGAPKEVMETTLAWIRSKYGTVSPGYLDAIGFDDSWRNRLLTALQNSPSNDRKSRL